MTTLTVLFASWVAVASASAAPDDEAMGRAEPPRIYIVQEPVLEDADAAILARLRPDLVCRGWFRWKDARDYRRDAPIVERCHELGVLLQGGNTLAAIYPGENGISEATFRDFTTRGPKGEMVLTADWLHVTLHNPKVREYLRSFVRAQIDAGVDGIWYDEIEGIYGWVHEGYDDYAIRAFADWLRERYVTRLGWSESDPRFTTELGIGPEFLEKGIGAFDYREWLLRTNGPDGRPFAENPWAGPWDRPWESANPLYRLWGDAWRPDERTAQTFQAETVLAFWREFVEDARRYARERYGRELIVTCNENGTPRPFVDFQQVHDGALPQVRADGRLDARYTALPWLDERVRLSERVAPGKPVVQFVDWPGETDRMKALPRADLLAFLYTYIPEAYAAGALFAPPVRGYSYSAAENGVLGETACIVDFLRRYDRLLFAGSKPSEATVEVGVPGVVARIRTLPERTVIHLLDHRPLEEREAGVVLRLTPPVPCAAAWSVAPHRPVERQLALTADGALELPDFRHSALLVLEAKESGARGVVRDAEGQPIAGALVTRLADPRTVATDAEGAYRFPGAAAGELGVSAKGFAPARGAGPDFRLASAGPCSLEGKLVDALGCPAVAVPVTARRAGRVEVALTDVEGRFRLSLPEGAAVTLGSASPKARLEVTASVGMAPVLLEAPPDDVVVGDFEAGDLWTPNDSEVVAGRARVLEVAAARGGPHDDSRCMEVTFAGLPGGGWSNAYSRPLDLSRARGLRFWYRGDGSDSSAALFLHALDEGPGSFYAFPLPLDSPRWQEMVVRFDEFRKEGAAPAANVLRRACVQVGFVGAGDLRPARVSLWGVRAIAGEE